MRIKRVTMAFAVSGTLLAGGLAIASPAAAAATVPAGGTMKAGTTLTSPNGAYRAQFAKGRLVVRDRQNRPRWATSAKPTAATSVVLDRSGNLRLVGGGRTYWSSRTAGAGKAALKLGNNGVLALTASRLLVWNSKVGNTCPRTRGKTWVVDISSQFARMCANGNQIRATPVTTGARGTATPTGQWKVYFKERNSTLRPSTGGAFKVKYWVAYNGGYGVHDAPWQKFAYGSQKYRTAGSHGCTRTPLRAVKFFFGWAKVGTRVIVKR